MGHIRRDNGKIHFECINKGLIGQAAFWLPATTNEQRRLTNAVGQLLAETSFANPNLTADKNELASALLCFGPKLQQVLERFLSANQSRPMTMIKNLTPGTAASG